VTAGLEGRCPRPDGNTIDVLSSIIRRRLPWKNEWRKHRISRTPQLIIVLPLPDGRKIRGQELSCGRGNKVEETHTSILRGANFIGQFYVTAPTSPTATERTRDGPSTRIQPEAEDAPGRSGSADSRGRDRCVPYRTRDKKTLARDRRHATGRPRPTRRHKLRREPATSHVPRRARDQEALEIDDAQMASSATTSPTCSGTQFSLRWGSFEEALPQERVTDAFDQGLTTATDDHIGDRECITRRFRRYRKSGGVRRAGHSRPIPRRAKIKVLPRSARFRPRKHDWLFSPQKKRSSLYRPTCGHRRWRGTVAGAAGALALLGHRRSSSSAEHSPSGLERSGGPARTNRDHVPDSRRSLYMLQRVRDEAHRFSDQLPSRQAGKARPALGARLRARNRPARRRRAAQACGAVSSAAATPDESIRLCRDNGAERSPDGGGGGGVLFGDGSPSTAPARHKHIK